MSLPRQGKLPCIAPMAYVGLNAGVSYNGTIGSGCQILRSTLLPERRELKPEACQPLAGGRAQRHPRSEVRAQVQREAMPAP
jgi:hypothetical protein